MRSYFKYWKNVQKVINLTLGFGEAAAAAAAEEKEGNLR